jgi:TPR repeat protein
MKWIRRATVAVTTLSAVAVIVFFRSKAGDEPTSRPRVASNSASSRPHRTPQDKTSRSDHPINAVVATQPASVDYRGAFAKATDYYAFVRDSILAARAGNPQAEFYVSEALDFCSYGYKIFFHQGKGETPPSLEEAIGRLTGRAPNSVPVIREVYERCHALMENDIRQWGTREEWLSKAADAGVPAAQAKAAGELITSTGLAEAERPPPITAHEQDPRVLFRRAVESRDPEALYTLAGFQGSLNERTNSAAQRQQSFKDRLAWILVACQAGYDCGEDARWHKLMCVLDSQCGSHESGLDWVYRVAQAGHLDGLDERAAELSAKLEAGSLDDLGLGG